MNYLFIDFETKSEAPLTKLNAWVYAEHKSADIICLSYKLNDEPVKTWLPGGPVPEEFYKFNYIVAHNALFEYAIIYHVLVKKYGFPGSLLNYQKYICTAAMSRLAGLPGSLEKAAEVLQVKTQKLDIGKKLINRYCLPKKNRTTGELYFIELEGQDKKDMIKYCEFDVQATAEIFNILKKLSNNSLDRKVFLLDFKQNIQGLKVNIDGVNKVIDFIDKKNNEIILKMSKKYPGLNLKSTQQFKQVLNDKYGITISNTQENTLLSLYKDTIPDVKELIDARLFLSKASIKKYQALKDLTSPDLRTRHFIRYYGAGTGRFAGAGFQPHNLPKSFIKNFKDYNDLEKIEHNNIIENLKKLLPTMIIADEGHSFILGDFAAIEARGLAYLANDTTALNAYKNDEDIYIKMAARIYHKKESEIVKSERQLGKAAILGCGYGMGIDRFFETCQSWGIDIDYNKATESVKLYRETYFKIPKFWRDIERAFSSILKGSDSEKVGLIRFKKGRNNVQIILPNGRILYYHKARFKNGTIEYFNYTRCFYVKLWGGILVENIVQAMCRDILTDRMIELEKNDIQTVFHVHDEVIGQAPDSEVEGKQILFDKIMNTSPDWLPGFPLLTESEVSKTYKK